MLNVSYRGEEYLFYTCYLKSASLILKLVCPNTAITGRVLYKDNCSCMHLKKQSLNPVPKIIKSMRCLY